MRNPFHQATIAGKYPGLVIDNVATVPIEGRREHLFRKRHANGICDPLAQWAGRGLDTEFRLAFGMSRRVSPELPEIPNLIHGQRVTSQVKQAIQEHRTVAI